MVAKSVSSSLPVWEREGCLGDLLCQLELLQGSADHPFWHQDSWLHLSLLLRANGLRSSQARRGDLDRLRGDAGDHVAPDQECDDMLLAGLILQLPLLEG